MMVRQYVLDTCEWPVWPLMFERNSGPSGGVGGGDYFTAIQAMLAETAKKNAVADAELIAKLDDSQKSRMNGLIAQADGDVALLDDVQFESKSTRRDKDFRELASRGDVGTEI